ncbi:MAG: aldehyde dehydrogenase family protein [Gammaproteobacteria bacterium]
MARNVDGEPRLLIDGALRTARSGAVFPNVDPATEQVLGETADAGPAEVDAAMAAARRAADAGRWAADPALRLRCLRQLHAALVEEEQAFRDIDTAEAGRPHARTAGSIGANIAALAKWIDLAAGYEYEQPLPAGAGLLRREPYGVVAAILTWNCGFFLNIVKAGPALLAGNTLILRPAPETPWQTTRFGRLIAERTDIPPGVVNVVASASPQVAVALTTDPRVDMVTLTGSTQVARQVMAQASATLKKVHLEAGGKSAALLLDDADFPAAIATVAGMLCSNAGQTCAALTRLLLPRSRYAEGIEIARAAMSTIRCGDPWDPGTGQGPQISARHRDRVLAYFERARAEGARVVLGGGRPADLPRGYFVEPTLFADVAPHSTIAQEEIFGPALAVTPYDGIDDAVRIANDSIYGLSGAVYGADVNRALDVARRLRTGQVSVNGGQAFGVGPFGGYKQSGIGREGGIWGFEEYLETKAIGMPR